MSNSTVDETAFKSDDSLRESVTESFNIEQNKEFIINRTYKKTELVFALVGAVGTKNKTIVDIITERLKRYNYSVKEISISRDVIPNIFGKRDYNNHEYQRITTSMDLGNDARNKSQDNSILALGAITQIALCRTDNKPNERQCYIISSLKHPEEVQLLREVYTDGFYLFGIDSTEDRRVKELNNRGISEEDARRLIKRDVSEEEGYGQHTRDTFQMSDFFVSLDSNLDDTQSSIHRILDLIFGNPHLTPTFEEYAMFMAFTSSLRSADLSRQVGAVIAKNNEIIASGANDTPRAGGGLYWPEYDKDNGIVDLAGGRDYTRGHDSNKYQQSLIVDEISKLLNLSADDKKSYRKVALKI